MKDMRGIEKKVRIILEHEPATRNSDYELYAIICKQLNEIACYLPFIEVMQRRTKLGLPKFSSVSRARRRLQARFPELRAVKAVAEERQKNEARVKNYAKDEVPFDES